MLIGRRGLAALAAGLALAFAPAAAQAAGRGAASPLASGQPVPGEVLVGFAHGARGSERAAARRSAGVTVKRALKVPGVQLVETARGETTGAAIARLERDPTVAYAEPNRWRTLSATTPNDPLFGQLWGLSKIGAPAAWDVATGGDAIVAVVDEGVAYDHPDLAPNLWTNPGEIAGNGVDDDRNGFADDVHGFDFADDDSDPRDFGGHGTHVAGTIAAAGDDAAGVVGVSWSARLMALRALGPDGGTDADIADAFEYAAANGARVVNASLGGPGGSLADLQTLRAPIQAHPETLFVVAAGNSTTNNDPIRGVSEYPCSFPDANLICVAATDENDTLASFSNYGGTSVDLAAPGLDVLSTRPSVGMTDGFETDDFAGRWAAHVDSALGSAWSRTSASAAGGSFSIADSPGGDYDDGVESYADLRTPVDLSGAGGCVLSFKARYELASGDNLVVDRTTNGWSTYSRIKTVTGSSGGAWQEISVPLAADGQERVQFGFGLLTNLTGVADGASVDDVAVKCTSPAPGTPVFAQMSGTSMATPHVSGAAALLLGRTPSLTTAELRSALLDSGDAVPGLAGKTVTGRRLNVANAIRNLPPSARTGASSGVTTSGATLNGTLNPRSTATSWLFEYGTSTAYGQQTATAGPGAADGDQAVSAAVGGLAPGTAYHYRLVAVRGATRFPGADATFTTATPPVVQPPVEPPVSLAKRIKAARIACSRKRGRYHCRVSLTRGSGLRTALLLKRGTKVVGRGSGRVGRRVTLKGRPARAGRYKVKLTFTQGSRKASIVRRIRVR